MTTYAENGIAKHRYRAGQCPGCREYLWADVTIDTIVKSPELRDDGKAIARVEARIVKVSLQHECAGEVKNS